MAPLPVAGCRWRCRRGSARPLPRPGAAWDTLLVEREEYLGGTGYAGLLRHVCGLYGHAPGGPEDTINPGLAQEIVRLLVRDNPSETVVKMGRVHVLPYRVDDLRRALLELAAAEQRLTLRHNAEVVAVDATGGRG